MAQLPAPRFASSDRLHYESEEDVRGRQEKVAWVDQTFPVIDKLMDEVLTERQSQIVRMYFLDRMTEREIAAELGLSAACVSQHLFGKMRDGKRVGGAIRRLRKAIEEIENRTLRIENGTLRGDRGRGGSNIEYRESK